MKKSKRKIAVVTGTRAEYGLLYWIIKEINEDPGLELQLIVTGMHLSTEFGNTVKDIERDGFPIAERIEMLLASDSGVSTVISMGVGMTGFAKAYERLRPDIILVLGDRFEIFAAVAAAIPLRIPVAHIHGGEGTEGVMDEQFRHAITKMSHIHFPATEQYAKRIIQMGEEAENVHCFGAPGLDNIKRLELMNKEELCRNLEVPLTADLGVVTHHPVTFDESSIESDMAELFESLSEFPDIYWVITLPNADPGGRAIMGAINSHLRANPQMGKSFASLGQIRYLSLLRFAVVMVGNSSSGIIEAPSFGLPVVNIGTRQDGRIKAKNVIDVPNCKKEDVTSGIRDALRDDFRESLLNIENPYGDGNTSTRIVTVLKGIDLTGKTKKRFHDLLFSDEATCCG